MRIICHLWVINHTGGFWSFQSAEMVFDRDIRPSRPNRHTTPAYISTSAPPPAQIPMPRSLQIYSINKPWAGPRQRIMVHLEVTGKENRALCITNRDRDKHGEALRNLDKGLTKHVRNWIQFSFLSMLECSVKRASPAVTVRICWKCNADVVLLRSDKFITSSHISPKGQSWDIILLVLIRFVIYRPLYAHSPCRAAKQRLVMPQWLYIRWHL